MRSGSRMTERADDTRMVAASETAARNPMRPPDTLPRDFAAALRVFATHPSPLLIALFVGVLGAWRLALGAFGWWRWRSSPTFRSTSG
jgi:hypothetical protein